MRRKRLVEVARFRCPPGGQRITIQVLSLSPLAGLAESLLDNPVRMIRIKRRLARYSLINEDIRSLHNAARRHYAPPLRHNRPGRASDTSPRISI